MIKPLQGLVTVFVLAALNAHLDAGHPCYETVTIEAPSCGFPFGPPPLKGEGLNDATEVVGYIYDCEDSGVDHAFSWSSENGLSLLDAPDGVLSAVARDVNNSGVIVGEAVWEGLGVRAFALADGQWITIPPESRGVHSGASAVNEASVVVGYRDLTLNLRAGFVWTETGLTDIPPPAGEGYWLIPYDVNDVDVVVGWTGLVFHTAILWTSGFLLELPGLPRAIISEARAINDEGTVVGYSLLFDERYGLVAHGFMWSDAVTTEIELPDGSIGGLPFIELVPVDINNAGTIVGECGVDSNNGASIGFVHQDGETRILNDLIDPELGAFIGTARAINDKGQILADALTAEGNLVALLLTPIDTTGDLTSDCRVNAIDLGELLKAWGECDPPAEPGANGEGCPSDLDDDGLVNGADLGILLLNWTD